jgi:hypothetical protein
MRLSSVDCYIVQLSSWAEKFRTDAPVFIGLHAVPSFMDDLLFGDGFTAVAICGYKNLAAVVYKT